LDPLHLPRAACLDQLRPPPRAAHRHPALEVSDKPRLPRLLPQRIPLVNRPLLPLLHRRRLALAASELQLSLPRRHRPGCSVRHRPGSEALHLNRECLDLHREPLVRLAPRALGSALTLGRPGQPIRDKVHLPFLSVPGTLQVVARSENYRALGKSRRGCFLYNTMPRILTTQLEGVNGE
jgi:hypothetical protein